MSAETVVANPQRSHKPQFRVSRAQLHADLMVGWARGIATAGGKGSFADKMDLTLPGIDKQLAGSMPGFEQIIAVMTTIDEHVLDEVWARVGKRLVDVEALCDLDDLSLLIARVLVMIQEAEHPDGPGGRKIVPQEYLSGEALMRKLHAASGRWLERCDQIRRPDLKAVRSD